jgi:hypothetical protein
MESPFPIVGQEFVFAGTYLPSCSLATDIHVTEPNIMLTCASIALSPTHKPRGAPFMVRTEDTLYVKAKSIYFLTGVINSLIGIDISVRSKCSCNLKIEDNIILR